MNDPAGHSIEDLHVGMTANITLAAVANRLPDPATVFLVQQLRSTRIRRVERKCPR